MATPMPPTTARRPIKSEQTLSAIVDAAMELAGRNGLHNVTLNAVAAMVDISKSGVFVRVGSVENLQKLVLDAYEQVFVKTVFVPAMSEPRGLRRLGSVIDRWATFSVDHKALMVSHHAASAYETDEAEGVGALKKRLNASMAEMRRALERMVQQAVDEGQLRSDTEPGQLVFEIFGLMSAYLYDAHRQHDPLSRQRLDRGYARLLSTYRTF
jgi:AcrR family transcriptional regulator